MCMWSHASGFPWNYLRTSQKHIIAYFKIAENLMSNSQWHKCRKAFCIGRQELKICPFTLGVWSSSSRMHQSVTSGALYITSEAQTHPNPHVFFIRFNLSFQKWDKITFWNLCLIELCAFLARELCIFVSLLFFFLKAILFEDTTFSYSWGGSYSWFVLRQA